MPTAQGAFFVLLAAAALAGQATAQPQPTVPAARAEYRVAQVRPNLWVLSGPDGNIALWSGTGGTVAVDDGPAALAPQLLETVGRLAKSPLRFVVNSDWHPDHTGGNEALARAGATIVAHENVREHMGRPQPAEAPDGRAPAAPPAALPVVTFADGLALALDGERIALVHVANAHTDSDVVVRWQEANVVYLGDLFDNGGYPLVDLANGGSLAGLVAALEAVLARIDSDTIVIPGHGPPASRADLAAYRDMLVYVGRKLREQAEAGSSVDEVLALRPTADFDERYGKGAVSPERFVRTLYRDLSRPRSAR